MQLPPEPSPHQALNEWLANTESLRLADAPQRPLRITPQPEHVQLVVLGAVAAKHGAGQWLMLWPGKAREPKNKPGELGKVSQPTLYTGSSLSDGDGDGRVFQVGLQFDYDGIQGLWSAQDTELQAIETPQGVVHLWHQPMAELDVQTRLMDDGFEPLESMRSEWWHALPAPRLTAHGPRVRSGPAACPPAALHAQAHQGRGGGRVAAQGRGHRTHRAGARTGQPL